MKEVLETMAEKVCIGDHGYGRRCWRPWLKKEVLETIAEEGSVGDHG